MKKFLSINIILLSVAGFFSCDHEHDFPGVKDDARPKEVKHYETTYLGTPFTEQNPASATLPAWLYTKYYSCDEGSTAKVKYDFREPAVKTVYIEDFERNIITDEATSLPGWLNITTKGDFNWLDRYNANNTFTQFSANRAPGECEAWLITPRQKISKGMYFSFRLCVAYYNADCLQILLSENYAGDITRATWVDITSGFDIPQEPASGYGDWNSAGNFSLDGYNGSTVCIAFKYTGDGTDNKTTTYQIDDVGFYQNTTAIVDNYDEYEFKGQTEKWVYVRTVPKDALSENFEEGPAVDSPIAISGWLNYSVESTVVWEYKRYNSNRYAQIRVGSYEGPIETWLITPPIEIGEDMKLSFDVTVSYFSNVGLSVWISTDFEGTGESIKDASWTDITSELDIPETGPANSYGVMGPAGSVDLSEYAGQDIYIGFKYVANSLLGESTNYQIDNIVVGK